MPCRDCAHFLSSVVANKPRWGLEGYGYCKVAPDVLARALFFHEMRSCWQVPHRYQERRPS